MRMVRLPRRHKNSVPSWVDVTTVGSRAGQSAEGSVSNVASNKPQRFAPRLSSNQGAGLASHSIEIVNAEFELRN